MERLPPEYRHEPALGLKAGQEGLDAVLRILREAHEHLHRDGLLVVEIGENAPALRHRFPEVPFVWPELERGGEGVFVLSAQHVLDFHRVFAWEPRA
jgi:ribosomal protein L3 glutamine methyltransferase